MYGLILYDGSTATTTAVGNITGSALVQSGSTLTLGADLNVNAANGSGGVAVQGDNSTLDAQGHKITALQLSLGWGGGANVRLLNRGDLAVTCLDVANQNFNLTTTDQVTTFTLSNGSTTFVPAGVVQNPVPAGRGNGHDLGRREHHPQRGRDRREHADPGSRPERVRVNVSGLRRQQHDQRTGPQDHRRHPYARVGAADNVRLLNRGALAVGTLWVANQSFNLAAADQVTNFNLVNGSSNLGAIAGSRSLSLSNGSTATTAAAGNVTGTVEVSGSTLTLGADLSVSGLRRCGGTGTLDAQGPQDHLRHPGPRLQGGTNVRFLNKGVLDVTNLVLVDQS